MRLIKQKHKTACGVACLAMVMDISYRQAMKLLHSKRFWWFSDATTTLGLAVQILESHGYEIDAFGSDNNIIFTQFEDRAILAIEMLVKEGEEPYCHAVVWDPETKSILDPWMGSTFLSIKYCLENFHAAIVIKRKNEKD